MLLLVLRHAKAENSLFTEDHERPLTRQGRHDATELGKKLKKKHIYPDLIVLSSSTRTKQTVQAVLDGLEMPTIPVYSLDSLYNASQEDLLDAVNKHLSANVLLICAHNPGISNFLSSLIKKESFISLSPCDLGVLDIPSETSSAIDWHSANLKDFIQAS